MRKFFQIVHVELENSFSMPELCNDFVVKDFKENVNLSAIHIKNEVYICTRVLLLPHTTGVVLLKTIILWQHSFLWECCVAIWLAEKKKQTWQHLVLGLDWWMNQLNLTLWLVCRSRPTVAPHDWISLLNVYVLNFQREHKTYLHFMSFLFIDMTQEVEIHLNSQYHGCWCPGSLRRQDISSYDIDLVKPR